MIMKWFSLIYSILTFLRLRISEVLQKKDEKNRNEEKQLFELLIEDFKINDTVITVNAKEIENNLKTSDGHYCGRILGIDKGKRELHVFLNGMKTHKLSMDELKGDARHKYFATKNDEVYLLEFKPFKLGDIMVNESLMNRLNKKSYKKLVNLIDYNQ